MELIERDEDLKALLTAMKNGPRIEHLQEQPVGEAIQMLRLMTGCVSPAELAETCALSEKEIADIEQGKRGLDLVSMTQISAAVGLQVAHLVLILELAEAASSARG